MHRNLIAAFCLATFAALLPAQLLPDGGFENGVVPACTQGLLPAPWVQASNTNPGADVWTVDCNTVGGLQIDQWGHFPPSFQPHSGQRFAAGWSSANEAMATTLTANLIPGVVYRLSGWFVASQLHAGNSGYDAFLSSSPFRQTGYYLGAIGTSATAGVWTEHYIDFQAPPNVTWLVLDPRTDDNNYLGVDDLSLTVAPTNVGRFVSWGQALAGSNGLPVLHGSGNVAANQTIAVTMTGALANTLAVQVIGFLPGYMSLRGGVLVPNPDIVLFGLTDAAGTLPLSLVWPASPPSYGVFFQYGVFDGAAVQGVSMSNALQVIQ